MENIELRIPFDLKYTPLVEEFSVQVFKLGKKEAEAPDILQVRTAVNEAFINVIENSPESARTEPVCISFSVDPFSLQVELMDTGNGIKINDQLPPYPHEMVGKTFELLRTFDGIVWCKVETNRDISLSFESQIELSRELNREQISVGGLGISIMTKLMNSVEYHYSEDKKNYLIMKKTF